MVEKSDKHIRFPQNLKELIRKSGRTQLEIANATGISPTALSSYCTGARFPRKDQLYKLADYFQVSVGQLTDDPSAKPTGLNSNEASWILSMYDELDDHGKELVRLVAEAEIKRVRGL